MRVSALALITCSAAGALVVLPALAVQDTPITINGVDTVCTGVGSASDDPRWSGYPVKLVLANSKGDYMAGVHLALTQDGRAVAETDCDAPWILLKPPAGKYTATASLAGGSQSHSVAFSTNGSGPQKTLTITFTPPSAPAAQ